MADRGDPLVVSQSASLSARNPQVPLPPDPFGDVSRSRLRRPCPLRMSRALPSKVAAASYEMPKS